MANIQKSFAAGEIAPALFARTDLNRYHIGLRTLRNFFIAKQGGAYNRPGLKYLGEVKDSTRKVRLIEFVFGNQDTYVLEFGHLYMRVWRNGARVRFPYAYTEVVDGVETETTFDAPAWTSATAYTVGDVAKHGGIYYFCTANHTNQQPPNLNFWNALEDGIFEMSTPFSESQTQDFKWAQSLDLLVIVHAGIHPQQLIRSQHWDWRIKDFVFGPTLGLVQGIATSGGKTESGSNLAYKVTAVTTEGEEGLANSSGNTGKGADASNRMTISWTPLSGAGSYNVYRLVRSGPYTEGFIGSTSTSSFIDHGQPADAGRPGPPTQVVMVGIPGSPLPPPYGVPISPFHTYGTALNPARYPTAVAFSQQSLFFAASTLQPETVWKSKTGFIRNFEGHMPITDDAPLQFTLIGDKLNRIRHFGEVRQLLTFTDAAEWAINGNANAVITPDAINAKRQTYHGSAELPPVAVGGSLLFIQSRSAAIRDLSFDFERDGYAGSDLTVFSAHLFENRTIVDWAYAQIPNSVIWVVTSDGQLLSLTYIREHEMLAWARHDTDGEIENVAVVPEGNEDAVYVVVKRGSKRFIEKMASRYFAEVEDSVFLDSFLSYNGSPVAEVTGLGHLEGKEVGVFADGFVVASPNNPAYQKKVVTGGAVTLPVAASRIHVGLPYVSDLETLDIESSAGEKKIVTALRAYVEKSRGFWAGASLPDGEDKTEGLRETKVRTNENMNDPVRLHTEEMDLQIRGEWSKGGRVAIRNIDPIPLALLSITPAGFMPQRGER